MINNQLLDPSSIVVVGGSDDITKPGGRVLKNLIDGRFSGKLVVLNPKSDMVQGIPSFRDPDALPEVDLAIIAIAAKYCPSTMDLLASKKATRAFIVLSAGFSEENEEGAKLEQEMVDIVNRHQACLLGPNCIGFLNQRYNGVFTTPIPRLDPRGCDFISGSGATAVFIMETGIPRGLTFARVFSVGNSAQIGVEDVLKFMDEEYIPEVSSKVKILYLETVKKPDMLLRHAMSLRKKGCHIAAIKAGFSEAGSRAASSHTGAMATPDTVINALFRKAGIVRCYGRDELVAVASVFMNKEMKGKNMAVISHAGGPAVMMTDTLTTLGLNIPHLEGPVSRALLDRLYPGSSVANPIDFLATGTADQLDAIIDACENEFSQIDGMAVIFGNPGLFPVDNVYEVIHKRMDQCRKPVFPVLPSVINASREIKEFVGKGRIYYQDEVTFATALAKVCNTSPPAGEFVFPENIDHYRIREVIGEAQDGFLAPHHVGRMLDAAGISRPKEKTVKDAVRAIETAREIGFPLVMKVVGPVHKSDVGGVLLGIDTMERVTEGYSTLMKIRGAEEVLIQSMHKGIELFAGVKAEPGFGHLVMCGLGGVFVEVLNDVQSGLSPLTIHEALMMIRSLHGAKILEGVRGREETSAEAFADVIWRLSALVSLAPEIQEMDLNPIMGSGTQMVAVDARIMIRKQT